MGRCASCYGNRIAPRWRTEIIKLLPATNPFESLSMDLFERLMETTTGNVFLLITVDSFSKLVPAVPLAGISAADASAVFYRD